MNTMTMLTHTCDIRRKTIPADPSGSGARDMYGQPRVAEGTVLTSVPCSYQSNTLRSLFNTDVERSVGSIIASVFVEGSSVPGLHYGDIVTNIYDRGGNLLDNHEWFIFRIINYPDEMGVTYYELMISRDEAGPRNDY